MHNNTSDLFLELNSPQINKIIPKTFFPQRESYPLELEIGIGKGKAIINRAEENPKINLIGIDWSKKYLRIAASRIQKMKLQHQIHLIKTEAVEFLKSGIQEYSLSTIYIYFPDPWPKKKHHKRRLLQEKTIQILFNSLNKNGKIFFITDHKEYFNSVVDFLKIKKISFSELETEKLKPATNYWIKYKNQGKEILGIEIQKNKSYKKSPV